MTLLARTLSRIVGFLLMVLLSLAGLAAMVFAIQGGEATLSYPQLAEWLRLPELEDEVGTLLARLTADGPVAIVTLLAGLAAMALGALLIAGALVPRRERLATLEEAGEGRLAARRSTLEDAAEALARRTEGVTSTRARVVPGRVGDGRLRVRADLTRSAAGNAAAREALEQRLDPLARAFHLRPKVSTRAGEGRSRVQ